MFALLILSALAQNADPLLEGRYKVIPAGLSAQEKAAWAFARYHLAPSREMVKVAREAHEGGEPLGTFVLLLCHRNGIALRYNEKTMWRLNHELRMAIEKKKKPGPMEQYMLSHARLADEKGFLDMSSPLGKRLEREGGWEGRRRSLLAKAAEGGCAQAMNDLGRAHQDLREDAEAYAFYERAAKSGLAAGLRNQGYMMMTGRGVERDAEEAFRIGRKGAENGDTFAMVNVAVYYDKGMGVKVDPVKARAWIAKAAETGHWVGAMEMAGGYLEGHYGFKKDAVKGKEWATKAIETRQADVLNRFANFYYRGFIMDRNVRKAVEFAEAAFVQGKTKAARLLSHIYQEGSDDVPKNETLQNYWFAHSNPSIAYSVGIDESHPDIARRLRELDPWKLEIE